MGWLFEVLRGERIHHGSREQPVDEVSANDIDWPWPGCQGLRSGQFQRGGGFYEELLIFPL